MILLNEYDIIIINSSAGKDSLCSIFEICRLADEQNYSRKNIYVSHQCLGESEWKGTKELAKEQADFFGLQFIVSKKRNAKGKEGTLLEYVERRRKWPSNKQRWCTSDFKRGPGARVVTSLTKNIGKCKVLYVFGFRAYESAARRNKKVFQINKRITTLTRTVHEYLSTKKVWQTIKENKLPYHYAYDLGMPRLSCVFCIFSPFDALVIAGKENPELLEKYVSVEKKIGHTFRKGFPIESVQKAINNGYTPESVSDWIM